MRFRGTMITILLLFTATGFAQRPHFDVASIKPVKAVPDGARMAQDAGRIHYVDFSFRGLMAKAYRREPAEVDGPAWIDSAHFDVDATFTPASESQAPEMLQSLLAERFRLRAHTVTSQTKGYVLRIRPGGAGVLKPSNEPKRTPMLSGNPLRIEATSSTMSELCRLLTYVMHVPVVDETGLSGAYTYRMLMPPATNPEGYNDNTMSGAILASFKEIGLTAVSKTLPVTRVVIDSAQQTPGVNLREKN